MRSGKSRIYRQLRFGKHVDLLMLDQRQYRDDQPCGDATAPPCPELDAPRNYLGRFYVDSLVHDAEALRYLMRLIGAERIALGSDYPFPLGEAVPGALIESMDDLDAATRARLLGGTALEFLAVDRSRFS